MSRHDISCQLSKIRVCANYLLEYGTTLIWSTLAPRTLDRDRKRASMLNMFNADSVDQ